MAGNSTAQTDSPLDELLMFTEYNGTKLGLKSYLSSGNASGGLPVVLMSITATSWDKNTGPKPNQTVRFDTTASSYIVPEAGDWPVTVTTNSVGQARVVVKGTGTTPPEDVNVTAMWVERGVSGGSSITLTELAGNTTPAPAHSWSLITGACTPGIKFQYQLQWAGPYVNTGRTKWFNTGRVKWILNLAPQIRFSELYSPVQDVLAYTVHQELSGESYKMIVFNGYHMNAKPNHPTIEYRSYYAPIGWRHDNVTTVVHEIGHALYFDHYSNVEAAMHGGLENYFVRKIEGPTDQEVEGNLGFKVAYPLCGP